MTACRQCGSTLYSDDAFCSERCHSRYHAGSTTTSNAAHEAGVVVTHNLTVSDLPRSGSWYTLPDGTKVSGKQAAQDALDALN